MTTSGLLSQSQGAAAPPSYPRDYGRRDRLVSALLPILFIAVAVLVGVATYKGHAVEAALLAAVLLIVLVSVRWPLVPLFAWVILIPLEDTVVISGFGALNRYAAVLFIAAYGIPRLGRLALRAMPATGWAYIGWAILTAVWAVNGNAAWGEAQILSLLFATATMVAVVVVDRPSVIRPLLWAYTLSAAMTALVGVVDYVVSGAPTGPNDRIAAIQNQNPAYFATILLPAVIFSIHELLNGRLVVLSALVTLLCSTAIIASGTRATWLSLAIVLVVFVVPRLRPARRVAAFWVVFAVLAITLQLPGVSSFISERTDSAVSSGGAGRTDIWSVGLQMYATAPITGVGLANFSTAFTPDLIRDSVLSGQYAVDLAHQDPHSILIGTLAELGPIGLVLLVLFLAPLVLRRGWGPDADVIQAALASLLVTALFLDVVNRKQFWLLIGIACGLGYLQRRSSMTPIRLPGRGWRWRRASKVQAPGPSPSPAPMTLGAASGKDG